MPPRICSGSHSRALMIMIKVNVLGSCLPFSILSIAPGCSPAASASHRRLRPLRSRVSCMRAPITTASRLRRGRSVRRRRPRSRLRARPSRSWPPVASITGSPWPFGPALDPPGARLVRRTRDEFDPAEELVDVRLERLEDRDHRRVSGFSTARLDHADRRRMQACEPRERALAEVLRQALLAETTAELLRRLLVRLSHLIAPIAKVSIARGDLSVRRPTATVPASAPSGLSRLSH
jgi:hypothetical protein